MPALPFQDLPVVDRARPWDGAAARRRVREFATTDGTIDFDTFARAFMFVDAGRRELLTGYRLGFADVIDGRLRIVPRGVFATASGGRGIDATGLSTADKASAKRLACRYYRRIADQLDADDIACPFAEQLRASVAKRLVSRMREADHGGLRIMRRGSGYVVLNAAGNVVFRGATTAAAQAFINRRR